VSPTQTKKEVPQLADFEVFGAKHNEAVFQAFRVLQSTKQAEGSLPRLNRATASQAVQSTKMYAELGHHDEAEKSQAMFKADMQHYFVQKQSLSGTQATAKVEDELSLEDLHEAQVLSDAQMKYIGEIDGLESPEEVRKVAQQAAEELGEAGNIVLIYASTYLDSLGYWKENFQDWKSLVGGSEQGGAEAIAMGNKAVTIGDVDGGSVAAADAAGAAIGAIGGAWSSLTSGAAAAVSTAMGPGGAVVATTGAALVGAAKAGASASIVTAAAQAGASEED